MGGGGGSEPPNGKLIWDSVRPAMVDQTFERVDGLSKFGATVACFVTVVPALMLAGFVPDPGLGLPLLLAIPAAGCAVGFGLFYTDRRYWRVGILPGLLTGPAVVLAVMLYVASRASIYVVELAIPIALGGLPGYLLWKERLKRAVLAGSQRPPTRCPNCGRDQVDGDDARCPPCGVKPSSPLWR